ncbi:MAG TPA: hypothetical protein ENH35_04710 [Candidatus Moranbacteria bacterium]|nr:hypothetical protein [Candidatus Moranbacteria bacterium]
MIKKTPRYILNILSAQRGALLFLAILSQCFRKGSLPPREREQAGLQNSFARQIDPPFLSVHSGHICNFVPSFWFLMINKNGIHPLQLGLYLVKSRRVRPFLSLFIPTPIVIYLNNATV